MKNSIMRKEKPQPYTKDEINTAYAYQIKNGWTFHNKSEILESTFNNRFNFLLLAYSLFLNTYFLAKGNIDKLTILVIGFIIILLLSISIFRAYTRFRILLGILYELDDKDALRFIRKEYENKRIYKIFSPGFTTGVIIPIVMILSFFIEIILYILSKVFHLFTFR